MATMLSHRCKRKTTRNFTVHRTKGNIGPMFRNWSVPFSVWIKKIINTYHTSLTQTQTHSVTLTGPDKSLDWSTVTLFQNTYMFATIWTRTSQSGLCLRFYVGDSFSKFKIYYRREIIGKDSPFWMIYVYFSVPSFSVFSFPTHTHTRFSNAWFLLWFLLDFPMFFWFTSKRPKLQSLPEKPW